MRHVSGILLFIIGLILVVFGVVFSGELGGFAGFVSREVRVAMIDQGLVQLVKTIAPFLKPVAGPLMIREFGLIGPLAVPGGVIALVGFYLFVTGIVRAQSHKKQVWAKLQAHTAAKTAAETGLAGYYSDKAAQAAEEAAAGGKKIRLNVSDPSEEKKTRAARARILAPGGLSMEELVKMEQGEVLTPKACARILETLRPQLMPFATRFSDDFFAVLARQCIAIARLQTKRVEDDMSPAQFRRFEEKAVQMERDTIGRLFAPQNRDDIGEEFRRKIGGVFGMQEQSALQQKILGTPDDWRDISVRNLAETLKKFASPNIKESGEEND